MDTTERRPVNRRFPLSRGLFNRSFLQIVFVALSLLFLIYFLRNERIPFTAIKSTLKETDPLWLGVGLLLCLAYFVLQGTLYVYSFRSIGLEVHLDKSITLFLKRNFVSTFLPAGTFTSLAFFEDELDPYRMSTSQIRYGSFLFAMASITSVLVVAIPALGILLLHHQMRLLDLFGFLFLFIATAALAWAVYGLIRRQGVLYRLLCKISPAFVVELNELRQQHFVPAAFAKACLFSLGIEACGIAHLYVSMIALGLQPSLEISLIGYVIMIIILSVSPFLKGVGAIEISVTYILTLYGLPTVTSASVVLLFRLFEFWIPFAAGLAALLFKKGNLLLRVFPALLLLILGSINIISALSPAVPYRLHLLRDFVPLYVTEFSNVAVLLLGVIMIISSAFLLTGARNAWKIALTISLLSLVGHLTKAIDYEEATFALLTAGILVYTRKAYFIKHDIRFQLQWMSRVGLIVAALFAYALMGFYLLNKRHLGFEATFADSLRFASKSIVFMTGDFTPLTGAGKYFLLSIQAGSAVAIGYILFVTLRPSQLLHPDADQSEAAYLVSRHGHSSLDYFKAYPDKQLFFNDEKTAFLAFAESRNYAVVLENPVAPDADTSLALLHAFEHYCLEGGLRTFYFRINEEDLPTFVSLKKKAVLIGQEAIVELTNFDLEGGERKALRHAIRKIEHEGLRFNGYHEPLSDGLIQKLKNVSDEWLRHDEHDEAGFSQGVFLPDALRGSTVFTVETQEEKILAFTNSVPSYRPGECTYDLFRYVEGIPNGTLDFLVVHLIRYFRDNGFTHLNMGLASLAGAEQGISLNEQLLRLYRDNFRKAARFKGSFEFKDKFGPRWENKYLAYEQLYDLVRFPAILSEVSAIRPRGFPRFRLKKG